MGVFDGLKRLKLEKIQPGKILGAVVSTFPGGEALVQRVDTGIRAVNTLADSIRNEARARGVPAIQVAAEKGEAALRAYEQAERNRTLLIVGGIGLVALIAWGITRKR